MVLALFAGCGHQTAFAPFAGAAPAPLAHSAASSFKLIYSFKGSRPDGDGAKPLSRLVELNGKLYGTTDSGGAHDHGTVFELGTDGSESVIYSFSGAYGDGAAPNAGLTAYRGALYGTTRSGGSHGRGTVFEVKPGQKLRIIFNFDKAAGIWPHDDLLSLFGVLYGTTEAGGAHDRGTVFSITPAGHHQVLHSFSGGAGLLVRSAWKHVYRVAPVRDPRRQRTARRFDGRAR